MDNFTPTRQTADIAIIGGGIIGMSCACERRFGSGSPDDIYHKEILDTAELRRHYPWIKPEGVKGGVLFPNRGLLVLDLQPVLGRREQLNFGVLDVGRFDRGALLNIELRDGAADAGTAQST